VFRSKGRPIVIQQYEHGRLAGTMASFWGNQEFERLLVDFGAFSAHEFQGIIIGYCQIGYPETLTPEIIRFRGVKGT